jgi:hypothetical protein
MTLPPGLDVALLIEDLFLAGSSIISVIFLIACYFVVKKLVGEIK